MKIENKRDLKGKFIKNNNFLSFDDAKNIVSKLGILNCKDWQRYTKSSSYNHNIPLSPDFYYHDWTNWYDFLGKSRDARTYFVNDNYFKNWSHNMAYILGFWFADGYMKKVKNKSSCVFSIKQHINDRYLLEQILQEMNSNYPIREDGCSCYFEINSVEIYNDLIKLGGKERKSLDVVFPYVPNIYLPDFIRGLWDGDGSISAGKMSKRTGKHYGYKASICGGNKKFLLELKKTLENHISGIHITEYEHKVKKGTIMIGSRTLKKDSIVYYLHLSPNNLRMLRYFMYLTPSSLKMNRKYEKFMAAGEYYPAPIKDSAEIL